METIKSLTTALVEAITNSDSHQQYERSLAEIAKNTPLAFKIKEFKRAELDYQMKNLSPSKPSFQETRMISKLYADLLLDPLACQFLTSERQLLDMVTEVTDAVSAGCGIKIDFS